MKFAALVLLGLVVVSATALEKSETEAQLAAIEAKVLNLANDNPEQTGKHGRRSEFDSILDMLNNLKDKLKSEVESTINEQKVAENSVRLLKEKVSQTSANLPLIETLINMVEKIQKQEYSKKNSQSNPHTDCKEVKDLFPESKNGVYWVYGRDGSSEHPFKAYCDMERDGGGWTLILKTWHNAPSLFKDDVGVADTVGNVDVATSIKGTAYKLSDAAIRSVIGPKENFDMLVDQMGYNSAYSHGNYEYVIVRDYTGRFTFTGPVAASRTKTTFQSYRASDNKLAWTGDLQCGIGGSGINCHAVVENNPAGGSNCNINMGYRSSDQYHHVFMAAKNTDSYLYVCNGAQHSSSSNMNHRFFVRARD